VFNCLLDVSVAVTGMCGCAICTLGHSQACKEQIGTSGKQVNTPGTRQPMIPAVPGRSFGSRSREWLRVGWLWWGRWNSSFTRRRYDDTTRYLTLTFTLIRHIHLDRCIASPIITYILAVFTPQSNSIQSHQQTLALPRLRQCAHDRFHHEGGGRHPPTTSPVT
jgi:hypothetical protein